eukprot:gene8874-9052_t
MQALPPVRREASTTDYPFPCLRNPEDEFPADGIEQATEDDGEEDDDVFGEGFDDDEIQKGLEQMRLSSVAKIKAGALSADGNALVDYDVHPQHRRDGKEALPSGTPGAQSGSYRSNFITPAVLGSLPKGLTMAEKAAVGSSMGMSPAAQRMQDIPELQANSATAAGIRFRRAVLRDSVVAFITAGYSGKRFVFEKAKDLGVRSIILDGPDSWSQTLVGEGLVEQFVPIDFADAGTVVDRCMVELIKIRDEIGLDGVTTFNEFAVPLVARLAERLGLPASAVVEKAAEYVGFPAVIKPIAAAASMGVVRVDNLLELKAKGHLRESVEGQEVDAAQKAQVAQVVSNTLMMEEELMDLAVASTQHLLASCGLAAKPLIAAKPIMRLAEYSINAPVTGVVESVDFLEPWSSKPEVVYARPLVEVGERVSAGIVSMLHNMFDNERLESQKQSQVVLVAGRRMR